MTTQTSKLTRRRFAKNLIFAIFFGVMAIANATSASAKETVRIGHFSWPGYGFLYVAQEKNLSPNLDFEFTIIEDPVQLFSLLSTDQLDTVFSTIEFGPIATAENMGFKLISIGNLGYGSDNIVVRPDIKTAADLKGKSVAVLEGGLSHIMMGIWLEENGVKWDEVKMVNLVAGDAAAAMMSGEIAAAELWDPFGAQVLNDLPGARSVSNSIEPKWLKSALIADAIFMSDKFTMENRSIAVETIKAIFAGVEYWRKNPTEANEIIAKATGFTIEDVQAILGGVNNPDDGGLYMYSLEEAGRFCGSIAGDPPFGQRNGQMADHWKMTNEWWVKFGFMDRMVDSASGTDCALLSESR
ncbi:ABC transporter substrate-binding protein [bacterium]|nr:ABC transporter substrate-binding protein [bacterium]